MQRLTEQEAKQKAALKRTRAAKRDAEAHLASARARLAIEAEAVQEATAST